MPSLETTLVNSVIGHKEACTAYSSSQKILPRVRWMSYVCVIVDNYAGVPISNT